MPAAPASSPPVHRPVLAAAAVELLVTDAQGVYVDGTFGRGGHARLILERLGLFGRLIAFDRDPAAQAEAAAIDDPRFTFVRTRFSRMVEILDAMGIGRVQGVLLDVGVSSPQIDVPERGFSWRFDAPLDMRMDPESGETAAQWLARASVSELTRAIREYGEERFAAPIAKALVARREAGRPIERTGELAAVVASAIPRAGRSRRADPGQHPATRTFQALRIHVNQELEELALALPAALAKLAPGGRLAVVSFHSLEDRLVKRFIAAHAQSAGARDPALARLPLRDDALPAPTLRAIARVLPEDAEIEANPRARSAVLRVAERTDAPLAATA